MDDHWKRLQDQGLVLPHWVHDLENEEPEPLCSDEYDIKDFVVDILTVLKFKFGITLRLPGWLKHD